MSSKSLQINATETSVLEAIVSKQVLNASTIASKIKSFFVRSQMEQAQAGYQLKRKREALDQQSQDIVNGLPLQEKQSLGMYRFMD